MAHIHDLARRELIRCRKLRLVSNENLGGKTALKKKRSLYVGKFTLYNFVQILCKFAISVILPLLEPLLVSHECLCKRLEKMSEPP